jgi:hypothetical protein
MKHIPSRFFFWLFGLVLVASLSAAFFASGKEAFFGEAVRIVSEDTQVSSLAGAVTVRFSKPADPTSYSDKNVSIQPSTPVRLVWNVQNTELSILPEGRWKEGARYGVSLGAGMSASGKAIDPVSFQFAAPSYPKVVSVAPEDGAKDVLLGIEDPITVRFDRSVKDFFIDFRLDPDTEAAYENNEDKTEFKLLPKKSLQSGTTYTLSVFAKWRQEGDDAYRLLASSRFTVLAERPEKWSQDVGVRLEEARKYTRPRILSGKYIDVNLESQTMALFEDGKMLDAYPVSSGKRGMDTPKGEYKIENKARRPWSKRYSLYMPYWMAIVPNGLFGIHELPEWPGGYKEGANHLGRPVSHGCVRLGVGPAERVWNWAEIGTPVVVH